VAAPRGAGGGEGYGTDLRNEPEAFEAPQLPNAWIALSPLVVVGVANRVFTDLIPRFYGATYQMALAGAKPVVTEVAKVNAIWAVEAALLLGILTVLAFALKPVTARFAEGSKAAIAGALLASMNTLRIRLRRRDRGAAGLPGRRRRAEGHPPSAGQRGDHRDHAGRHHRLGLRRHEHRAGRHGGHLHRQRPGRRHPAGGASTAWRPWPAAAWTRCRTTAR
jgi:hypothetical protein